MTEHYSSTPPRELMEQWASNQDYSIAPVWMLNDLATRAAQWGADQELEACCEWLSSKTISERKIPELRAARRPKPPSLKEQALSEVAAMVAGGNIAPKCGAIIRLALEQLQ